MVNFADIDEKLNETLRVARVYELNAGSKLLFDRAGSGLRRDELVKRFSDKFHDRYTTRADQSNALYLFQTKCLTETTNPTRVLKEKFRIKPAGAQPSSNVNGRVSSSAAESGITATSHASEHALPSRSNRATSRDPQAERPNGSRRSSRIAEQSNHPSSEIRAAAVVVENPTMQLAVREMTRRADTFINLLSTRRQAADDMEAIEAEALLLESELRTEASRQLSHAPAPAAAIQNFQSIIEHPIRRDVVGNSVLATTSNPLAAADVTRVFQKPFYDSYAEATSDLKKFFTIDCLNVSQTGVVTRPTPTEAGPIHMYSIPSIVYARIMHHTCMPFYRDVKVVMPPVHLRSLTSLKHASYCTGMVRFPHRRNFLTAADDKSVLLVRFFKMDPSEAQLDTFPPNVTVEIRGTSDLSHISPGAVHSTTLKRPSMMIFQKTKPKHEKALIIPSNFVQREHALEVVITYTPSESDFEFAVGIFSAREKTVKEELESIISKPLSYDVSKQAVMRELQSTADEAGIITTAETSSLPLVCPISKSRIQIPCRSIRCPVSHTCDARSFLQMNFERPTWRCFMCNKPVYLEELHYESFVASWLAKYQSAATGATINLELSDNGSDLRVKHSTLKRKPDHQGPNAAKQFERSSNRERVAAAKVDAANNTICLSSDDEDDLVVL